ncbi:NADH-quinone oxidoreductase subunit H [Candidatus Bathyarchaeota archaeon]|nr:NADH-quinone oxidoreductase subunit H [Candidatus Bathyarchaeota archaeon]
MVDLLSLNTYVPVLFVVLAPVIGGLLMGIDRKLTARMQSRIGPPILQPFYDAIKLWGKQPFLASGLQPVLAFGYFGFSVAAYALLAFRQDILLMIFTIAVADICLIVASFNSKSPYSNIGAKRELLGMMSYEPVMILAALNISIMTGTFMIQGIFDITVPLLPYLPLTFLAMIPVLVVYMKKSPFDVSASGYAHQELVRGIYTEFSGYTMALIELGHWTKVALMLSFITLFWAPNLIVGVALALTLFFVTLVIDNVYPRLDWKSMVKTTWTAGFLLIIANIIGLIVRLVAL